MKINLTAMRVQRLLLKHFALKIQQVFCQLLPGYAL